MPIFVNQGGKRMVFLNAADKLANTTGVSPKALENAVLTQSFIRLIQPLSTNSTIFTFPVLNNQQGSGTAVRVDEQRLNQQDAFFVSGVNVYITKAASATATNWVPYTYPSPVTFPTGVAQLPQVYNGKLIVSINNSTIVPAARMLSFLNVPNTQLTAATNSPLDGFNGVDVPPWEPNVVLVGLYNTTFQIQLPNGMTALDANVLAIIEMEGVLAQNVALGAPQ